jgi:ABC-type sugar transport system ATPase subunit
LPDYWQDYGSQLPAQVKFGIRPFYIDLSLDPSTPHDMEGEVFLSENLQDLCVVSIDIDDLRLQAVTTPSFRPERHERIYLKFSPAYIRFFDLQTGKALRPETS